jgi:hypothetical protein
MFAEVHKTLTERFGGVTWFSRAPAHGVTESGGKRIHDDIIVVEVMADAIDNDWWSSFRTLLEVRFAQEEILIRASHVQRL